MSRVLCSDVATSTCLQPVVAGAPSIGIHARANLRKLRGGSVVADRGRVQSGVPQRVPGDSLRIRQVLLNLASNAVKFTDTGVVTLALCGGPHVNGIALRFGISDTGVGIRPEVLSRLFGSFSQADSSTTRRYGGTGLGLAISHRLSQLMGGRIEVESVPDQGSTFTFVLPVPTPVTTSEPIPSSALPAAAFDRVEVYAAADHLREALDCTVAFVRGRPADSVGHLSDLAATSNKGGPMPGTLRFIEYPRPEAESGSTNHAVFYPTEHVGTHDVVLCRVQDLAAARHAHGKVACGFMALPARPSHIRRAIAGEAQTSAEQVTRSAPEVGLLSVLVVDDNLVNRTIAARMLTRLGHQATTVDGGRAAVTACREQAFDLVLMDCQMPGMDGFEATRAILAQATPHPTPRIVALTANVMAEDRARCEQAGMHGFLAKPLKLRALEEMLSGPPRDGAPSTSATG